MRTVALLTAGLLLTGFAHAQSSERAAVPERDEWARRDIMIAELRSRAQSMVPRRRDEPLREANISDYEVREIQHLLREHLPETIVNIGPVVTGCPCEEGRACTEQVYIQANTESQSVGLLLSRVNRRWDLSRAEKWWHRWRTLLALEDELPYLEFRQRAWELVRDFPACTPEDATPAKISAQPRAEPRK
jgi:hypothetical protein